MKGTDNFTKVIQSYLEERAMRDELFAKSYWKENKNIEECIDYILTEVQKSGCHGFADDEIYSMAVHYYDEDDIKVGNVARCDVVVNHHIELTEEEKAEAHRRAVEEFQREEYAKIRQRSTRKKPEITEQVEQPTLFTF